MSERQILPVVPLRSTVIFPGLAVPIGVGREATLRAIEAAARGDQRRKAEALEAAMTICRNVGLGHYHRRAERLLADAQGHSVGYA